jgi:AraC-like DNA-binding protein
MLGSEKCDAKISTYAPDDIGFDLKTLAKLIGVTKIKLTTKMALKIKFDESEENKFKKLHKPGLEHASEPYLEIIKQILPLKLKDMSESKETTRESYSAVFLPIFYMLMGVKRPLLGVIAECMQVSETTAKRFFVRNFDMTFTEYRDLVQRDMIELMIESGADTPWICEKIGFSSSQSMSRAVKRLFGTTYRVLKARAKTQNERIKC